MNMHLLAVAGAMALAQPLPVSAQAGTNDPALPRQAVAALRYDSAFADYKPWRDIKPADWRAVNDALVNDGQQARGHAGHSPAPAGADPAPSQPVPAKSPPKPSGTDAAPERGGHDTHRGHGRRR